jgi:hypothetical protein
MDKARRFKKEILQGANPDIGLVRTYTDAMKKGTWMEKLAPKPVRFGVVTIGGLALEALNPSGLGMALSVGLNAADAFILDKIFKGWRPNSFIEKNFRPFIGEREV